MASSSSSALNSQSPNLKSYFKTPEGRYKLQYEKSHPSILVHYSHGKAVSQLTIAYLKDKPANQSSAAPTTPTSSSGMRSAAARLLGSGNGSRALSFVGGNGVSRAESSRIGGSVGSSIGSSGPQANYDGKGTYLIFNFADTLFISDLNSQDKDPIKSIHFSNSIPVCHAFDPEAKDGHDLLIAVQSGDGSKCTCLAWAPKGNGAFVVGHTDGNLYIYEKSKDGTADCSFPIVKDQIQFAVAHAKSSKSNPVARWHICQGPINSISFSADGAYLATVGRDGYLRVFDYSKEQLIFGGKSYYGALLCCTWSYLYILLASFLVSGVAFDSYWSAPNSDGTGDNIVYRFGSVGQDAQMLLWDLSMDEIAVPLRHPSGGSPTFNSSLSHSAHWDNICPMGTLQPAPSMRDVPKLAPLVAHRVHVEPLSGLIFTNESVLTICREGHIKIWLRPGDTAESGPSNSDVAVVSNVVLKDRSIASSSFKGNNSSFKQQSSVLFT
ncbi:putative catabolite repression protein creC [Ananas comosus]|uniref:Putative catabolite repression protein creC n=1 Tax=Ananas comosus TaxID=4615 RepID=A0A199VR48_ANACO|nr:putative catabolite repression protein creC [Ananas comosus]